MRIGFLILALSFVVGCGAKKVRFQEGGFFSEKGNKGVELKVDWLKNKGDSLDLSGTVTNHYPHAVSFTTASAKISFDGKAGILKRDFPASLEPGESRKMVLVWGFSPSVPETGKVVFELNPIHKFGTEKKLPPLRIDMPTH